jgi:hypothetical protein
MEPRPEQFSNLTSARKRSLRPPFRWREEPKWLQRPPQSRPLLVPISTFRFFCEHLSWMFALLSACSCSGD